MAFLFKYPTVKICFNGCSFTVGEGFDESSRELYVYDRLLEKKFGFVRTNVAVIGSGNHDIFLRSAEALNQDNDIVITQWSALNRIWLYPGPDTVFSMDAPKSSGYNYRYISIEPQQRQWLQDTISMLNHDYKNIFFVIDYCKILSRLAEQLGKKVIFVNGLLPWQPDLVQPLGQDLSRCLSDYSKEILDFDHRDDGEIILFFSKLQQKFQEIDVSKWVNLFDSFQNSTVDSGPEGHHPGIKSHAIMANKIERYLVQHRCLA